MDKSKENLNAKDNRITNFFSFFFLRKEEDIINMRRKSTAKEDETTSPKKKELKEPHQPKLKTEKKI